LKFIRQGLKLIRVRVVLAYSVLNFLDLMRGTPTPPSSHPRSAFDVLATSRRLVPTIAALVSLLTLGGGCSFLYDLNTNQCQSTSDCKALGGDFKGLVCVDHLCVQPTEDPDDGGATDKCTSHSQCIEDNLDQPFICRDGECIGLYSRECPVVLQPQNLKVPEPIIVGAYSSIDPLNKEGSPITRTYNLAMQEFEDKVGGLSGGPNNTRRKFVTIVCEGDALESAPLENSLAHLIDTVKVPAIVASLFPEALREAFDARAKSDNVFFISPLAADSSLTSADNEGLLWFMLGAYRDLAPHMVALTQRAEAFQQAASENSEPTRVALVQGNIAPAQDIGQVLLSDPTHSLVFNGKRALDNQSSEFLQLKLTTDSGNDKANHAEIIAQLQAFKPHIIVVTGGPEFTSRVMPVVEANWNQAAPDQIPPFYVFGPLLAFDGLLAESSNSEVRKRLAGVNFSRAEDPTLYNMLKANYQATYVGEPFYDTENFYDAIYYLNYAIAAAGNPAVLGGDDIAAGIERLVSPSGLKMTVGPSQISNVLATLASGNARISLTGTMGPADFNQGTGSRVASGTVWCVDSSATFQYDVMRLDPESNEFEGTLPCVAGF
jgi:hypothetical protein